MTTFDLLTLQGFDNNEALAISEVLGKAPASDYGEGFNSWDWAYNWYGGSVGDRVKIYAASLMHLVLACGYCAGCTSEQAAQCMASLVDAICDGASRYLRGERADILRSRFEAEAVLIDTFNEITATV